MFLIREAGPEDFQGVFALARLLDSYNLPADRAVVRRLLEISRASFRGSLPRRKARYLFVLESVPGTDVRILVPGTGRIVGCSLIIAKHGTPGRPHLWFAQDRLIQRSRTLRVERAHEVLRLGHTEDGPTEIGGLVVLPAYRARAQRCGLQIACVRFLYMGMHPSRFESEVLIEYRGAMGRGNRSPFWQAVGHAFTGLPYRRADRLSVRNKEFIVSLLPREPIYCALLPKEVQAAIGAIHPSAEPAARMATRQGFRRIRQVEPFDGGPYYSARLREIRMVRGMKRVRVEAPRGGAGRTWALVGTEEGGRFRALMTRGVLAGGRWRMHPKDLRTLEVSGGDWVHVGPL